MKRTSLLLLFVAACSSSSETSTPDAGPAADGAPPPADAGPTDAKTADAPAEDAHGLGVACSGAPRTFAKDVAPILGRSCAGGEICHSGLATSPWSYAQLVNVPSTRDCDTAGVRVAPSSLEKSYLIHKLTGVGMCPGSDRMPRGGSPLPDAEIQAIADWICAGAKND